MKQTINFNDFYDAFQEVRPANFSYEGLRALFDWLEDYADDTGEEIELDVIALCCEFSEYESLEELQESYTTIQSIEDLHDETIVIKTDGGLIIQNF
tara:strand:+ start:481 stop:771 length:291 start_codon:yes stop_codon:yes gene_type:complete